MKSDGVDWVKRELERANYHLRQQLHRKWSERPDFDLTPAEEIYEESDRHLDMGEGNFRTINYIGDAHPDHEDS